MARRETAGARRAAVVRGPVVAALQRCTANTDAIGAIASGLNRLAQALEEGRWPLTDADLDTIVGPVQRDPTIGRHGPW